MRNMKQEYLTITLQLINSIIHFTDCGILHIRLFKEYSSARQTIIEQLEFSTSFT